MGPTDLEAEAVHPTGMDHPITRAEVLPVWVGAVLAMVVVVGLPAPSIKALHRSTVHHHIRHLMVQAATTAVHPTGVAVARHQAVEVAATGEAVAAVLQDLFHRHHEVSRHR